MDRQYIIFFGLGIELVVLSITLIYIGQFLDQRFGWNGFGIAGGAVLALVSWLTHLIFAMRKLDQEEK